MIAPEGATKVCRTFNHGPHPLHVHDYPPAYADIWRNVANGWKVYVGAQCQHPDTPFTDGNPGLRSIEVLDVTHRGKQ